MSTPESQLSWCSSQSRRGSRLVVVPISDQLDWHPPEAFHFHLARGSSDNSPLTIKHRLILRACPSQNPVIEARVRA